MEAVLNLSGGHWSGDGGEGFAARPGEAGGADAGGRRLARPAAPGAITPILARAKGALVQDSVAVSSTVTCRTDAGVVVDSVLAAASVEAGVTGTLVDVNFATLASKSCTAAAHTHPTVDQTQTTYRGGGGHLVSTNTYFLSKTEKLILASSMTHALQHEGISKSERA